MKERNISKRIGLVMIAIAMINLSCLPMLVGTASADSTYHVTVKWVIPGDYSISFSYYATTNQIRFETGMGKNFTGVGSRNQTASIRAMNITNIGNAAVKIFCNFTSGGMGPGVTYFNLTGNYSTQNEFYWTIGSGAKPNLTEQVICSNLPKTAGSNVVDFWAYSSGRYCPEGTSSKEIRIRTTSA